MHPVLSITKLLEHKLTNPQPAARKRRAHDHVALRGAKSLNLAKITYRQNTRMIRNGTRIEASQVLGAFGPHWQPIAGSAFASTAVHRSA